jgi:cold shock CspA family protein
VNGGDLVRDFLPLQDGRLQPQPALCKVPGSYEPKGQSSDQAAISRRQAGHAVPSMTQGVIQHLSHMFGTKWGRIDVAGAGRECFFNRDSLLNPEDFDQLGYGDQVEFDEQQDRTHGSRAVRLTIVRARSDAAAGAEQ